MQARQMRGQQPEGSTGLWGGGQGIRAGQMTWTDGGGRAGRGGNCRQPGSAAAAAATWDTAPPLALLPCCGSAVAVQLNAAPCSWARGEGGGSGSECDCCLPAASADM